ncbi:hypothetical protein LZ30DRAFT_607650 [Colletotrichum cereale]|nr:hypothetical protein LZ30DRAFT_607650 [Colletotrichum cereale]
MEASIFYILSFYGLILLFTIYRVSHLILPFFQVRVAQHVIYPLLFQSRRWNSPTRLQALLCCIYILGNVAVLLFPFHPFPNLSVIQRRAAVTALVNLLPSVIGKQILSALKVFLISSSSLQLAHYLISIMSLCEGLLHSAIVISQNPQHNQVTISGYSIFGTLIVFIFSCLWIFQRLLKNYFLSLHLLIATALFSTLIWHTLLIPALFYRIATIVCSLVFTITLSIHFSRRTVLKSTAVIQDVSYREDIVIVKLRTDKPMKIFPGCYFYLRLNKSNQFSYYPKQPIWYGDGGPISPYHVENFVFVLSNEEKHSRHIRFLEEGQQIHLSGPYGTDFRLQEYEEVILLAKGTGILTVLSYALTLCRRRNYDDNIRSSIQELQDEQSDLIKRLNKATTQQKKASSRDKKEKVDVLAQKVQSLEEQIKAQKQIPLFNDTLRRVDLLWVLEKGSQATWATEPFKALQKLDPKNRLIVVWCLYPNQGYLPMFETSGHWQCFYPGPSIADAVKSIKLRIIERQSRVKGKVVVASCGEADFQRQLRTVIIESMQKARHIEFMEFDCYPDQLK